jgi:LysR family glycine cleavage system transcriptional activator
MDRRTTLPPLAAIRVFEAAARLGSFTRAGEELAMTQAAVSYQVKLLEERLGLLLFARQPRQVTLTSSGRRLSAAATEAFDTLRSAFAAERADTTGVLTISAAHAIASNWLGAPARRLPARAPDTCAAAVHLRRAGGLRARRGRCRHPPWHWPLAGSCHAPPVSGPLHTTVQPGAPAPRRPVGEAGGPAAIAAAQPDRYLVAAMVRARRRHCRRPRGAPGIRLDSQQIEGRAAVAGQGVGVLTPALWAPELRSGRLVQPFDLVAEDGKSYWLVYPETRRNVAKIRAWRDWLLDEVQRSESEPWP